MTHAKTTTGHSYTVEVQTDFLQRQTKARPVRAVAESVWNGLDAEMPPASRRGVFTADWV